MGCLESTPSYKAESLQPQGKYKIPIREYERKEKAVARMLGAELQFIDFHALNITEG